MNSTTPPPILPPTSGLTRRGRRRGAQLDGEFVFYASGSSRRLRALPGGGGGGALSWTGSLLFCLSVPTSGLARAGRRRGAQVDGKFAFYASRRQLRACPRGGGGGAAYETGSQLFIVFGSRPLLRPGDNGEGAYGQRVCIPALLSTEFGPMEA